MKKSILSFFTLVMLLCVNVYAGGTGKIVFSNKPIDAATGESLPTATINVGEPIYCRVYLPKPLTSYKNGSGGRTDNYGARVYFNDETYGNVFYYLFKSMEDANVTTFEFQLLADDERSDRNTLIKVFNTLADGVYNVKVDLPQFSTNEKKFIAAGEFVIKKAPNSKVKIGTTFDNQVKPKMSDPVLEAKALKVLTDENFEKYSGNFKHKFKLDVLKIKIISEDWKINKKASTGVIIGRFIDFAILVKEKSGQCTIQVYRMEQQYNGSGYQDSFGGYVGPASEGNSGISSPHPLHNKPVDCE